MSGLGHIIPGGAAGSLAFRRAPEEWATPHVELIVSWAFRALAQGDHGRVPHAEWVLLDQRTFSFGRYGQRGGSEAKGSMSSFVLSFIRNAL